MGGRILVLVLCQNSAEIQMIRLDGIQPRAQGIRPPINVSASDNAFAWELGGGVDYTRVGHGIAYSF